MDLVNLRSLQEKVKKEMSITNGILGEKESISIWGERHLEIVGGILYGKALLASSGKGTNLLNISSAQESRIPQRGLLPKFQWVPVTKKIRIT